MTGLAHWKGRLRIGDFLACWSGSVGDTIPHRHFAAQAVFADDPVEVIDSQGQRYKGRCLLIEPEAVHCLLPASDAELWRSEEHTSELQSLMRISYAVFCLKKKNHNQTLIITLTPTS